MANTITKRTNTLTQTLDLVYKQESVTDILTPPAGLTRDVFGQANAIQIATRTVNGYGDYGRQNTGSGYPAGSVTQTFTTYTLAEDRGVSLTVDRLDNDDSGENAFLSLASLAGQFEREQATPEVDAYRFAKIAGTSGISTVTPANLTASTAKAAMDTALETMRDNEVPLERRVIFMSAEMYNFMKNSDFFTYQLPGNAEAPRNTRFGSYDGITVIEVPRSRFYTAIDLNDGSASFGYAKASAGRDINFMIIQMDAVVPVTRFANTKYFTPDANQSGDSHLLQFRRYHDIFVLGQKLNGVYLHNKTS